MSLPDPQLSLGENDPTTTTRPPLPPGSPSRRSVTISVPPSDGADARHHSVSKQRNQEVSEMLNSVEFVPPAQGTPAAIALAANAAIKVTKLDKGFHKFRGLKRPKMKSLNLVKKLNKITKQRREKRHFSKNFKGKVIDGVHELYTLTAGMMLGIRCSLVRGYETEAYHDNHSRKEDFEEVENVAFPPKGNTIPPHITPPHSLAHTFKFKSYAPKIFKQLREFFDIDPVDYMNSVCGDYNYVEFISNSKSGQFFFYSHDGKYMLKTQTKEENKFLIEILPKYYHYLKENPHSLLVRILGMHRVKMYHLRRKVHFVIMSSVFDTPAQINSIYDLKGSLVGRSASEKERQTGGVLKDCDLVNDHRKLHLGPKKVDFMRQLNNDARFLASLNVMDYSLLVGVHDRRTRGAEFSTGAVAQHESNSVPNSATTTPSAAVAEKHNSNLNTPHSNTPFRRSIHEGIQPGTAPSSRRASYQTNSTTVPPSKRNIEDSSTTAATDHDQYLDYSNIYHDSKDDEYELLNSAPPFVRSGSIGASHDQSNGVTPHRRSFSKGHAALRSNSVAEDESNLANAGETADRELNPDDQESDNEDFDEDDGDYDDIDEGDSDVSQEAGLEPTPTPAMSLQPPPILNPTSLPKVEEEHRDENFVRTDNLIKFHNRYEILYGNGITTRRPWTSRKDIGINARDRNGKRGNEIYFVGIIDILQEYNTSKRMETMFKGLTNDSRYISSVDPVSYAHRFVKFMDSNID